MGYFLWELIALNEVYVCIFPTFLTFQLLLVVVPDNRVTSASTGFCSNKHPTVAMVSGEVWEEDGSFLWHHCECAVFISALTNSKCLHHLVDG